MKQVSQKDIQHVEELWQMDMSVQRISDITKRTWSTVKRIIDSGFNLDMYKTLRKSDKMKKTKQLTFKPFKDTKAPGPVKVKEIPVKAENDINSLSDMDDVLNHMWELQQQDAQQLIRKAERDEVIHKLRNGLQKVNEALGDLLKWI